MPARVGAPDRRAHTVRDAGERDEREELERDDEIKPAPPAHLLADGRVEDPDSPRMNAQEFLSGLREAVIAAADRALVGTGRTTDGCPYLTFWFDYYTRRDARHIERALRRYAPETARVARAAEYIPIVVERVRRAVVTWARTGEITGVPGDLPAGVPGGATPDSAARGSSAPSPAGRSGPRGRVFEPVQLEPRPGTRPKPGDPAAVQAELGPGRPLESAVRGRMERAFGRSLGPVRLHTDAGAGRLASGMNARAFAVGRDVAFAAGEYRPGTPMGDALIAHELAHVVQQRAGATEAIAPLEPGGSRYDALERDADRTATGVVTSLWQGHQDPARIRPAVPVLRSGLRLQRCSTFSERSSERYHGYDASTDPDSLVVPVGGSRTVDVRKRDSLTITSLDPGIATVDATTPADGMTVTGVSHGPTIIEARAAPPDYSPVLASPSAPSATPARATELEAQLAVSVKDRKSVTVDYHYMSDNAGHQTTRSPGDEVGLTNTLNEVWERQANVHFDVGTVDSQQVAQDLGPIVTATVNTDPEWQAIAAFRTGGDYNVFLVWEFEQRGSLADTTADSATAGKETLLEDSTCDRYTFAHEAGHFLGLYLRGSHPSSGVMAGCGASDMPRVRKAEADIVNP